MSAAASTALRLTFHARADDGTLAPLPDHVAGLGRTARHLWEVLGHVADDDGTSWYAVESIARRMGITAANVRRAARQLEAAGVLTVAEGGGRGHTNLYRVPTGCPQPAHQRAGSDRETRAPARANPRASARQTRAPARGEVTEEVTEEAAPLSFDAMPTWVAGQIGRILSVTTDAVPAGATWDDYG